MFRKFALTAATLAAIAGFGLAGQTQKAEAGSVYFDLRIGIPATYYGPYYSGYYTGPRYRWRCHRHRRVVRFWHAGHGHWHRKVVRGPRHCRRVRVW